MKSMTEESERNHSHLGRKSVLLAVLIDIDLKNGIATLPFGDPP